jgi:hypothetical protein
MLHCIPFAFFIFLFLSPSLRLNWKSTTVNVPLSFCEIVNRFITLEANCHKIFIVSVKMCFINYRYNVETMVDIGVEVKATELCALCVSHCFQLRVNYLHLLPQLWTLYRFHRRTHRVISMANSAYVYVASLQERAGHLLENKLACRNSSRFI